MAEGDGFLSGKLGLYHPEPALDDGRTKLCARRRCNIDETFREKCGILINRKKLTGRISGAAAEKDRKTVRVGWHEVPYFITDADGRRSGYS